MKNFYLSKLFFINKRIFLENIFIENFLCVFYVYFRMIKDSWSKINPISDPSRLDVVTALSSSVVFVLHVSLLHFVLIFCAIVRNLIIAIKYRAN